MRVATGRRVSDLDGFYKRGYLGGGYLKDGTPFSNQQKTFTTKYRVRHSTMRPTKCAPTKRFTSRNRCLPAIRSRSMAYRCDERGGGGVGRRIVGGSRENIVLRFNLVRYMLYNCFLCGTPNLSTIMSILYIHKIRQPQPRTNIRIICCAHYMLYILLNKTHNTLTNMLPSSSTHGISCLARMRDVNVFAYCFDCLNVSAVNI